MMSDNYKPTMNLKWFPVEGEQQPRVRRYLYEDVVDYVLKQLWRSDAPDEPDEWRLVEMG